VERVDGCIADALKAKGRERPVAFATDAPALNVLLIAAHDPVIDPRLAWIEEGAPVGICVHQLGVLPPGRTEPRADVLRRGTLVLAQERRRWDPELGTTLLAQVAHSPAGMAGAQELLFIQRALELPEAAFCRLFGAPPEAERNAQFRWYLQYLLDTAASLVARATGMRGLHAIIATDLDTLAPALVLKGLFGVPVLYDAHEYWAEADVDSFEYEKQFWMDVERRLVVHADLRQTVSPGLAALMSAQYGVPFDMVPNCEPADRLAPARDAGPRTDGPCQFLFQGNFAAGRGIDLLIEAWAATDARAILQLRGPDNPFKTRMIELARATGLLDQRIFFPEAVRETELVAAAARADVGLIPYTPAGTNYRHCCPNKMSQYMAAGLPILANATSFVTAKVSEAGCGVVVDFARRELLVRAVDELCASAADRLALGQAGRAHFAHSYNWNAVGAGMYRRLADAMRPFTPEPLLVYAPQAGGEKLKATETPGSVLTRTVAALVRMLASGSPRSEPHRNAMSTAWRKGAPPRSRSYRVAVHVWRRLPHGLRRALQPLAHRVAGTLRG
jgi:glycosyltransferase involved in cell wall biosynthesis